MYEEVFVCGFSLRDRWYSPVCRWLILFLSSFLVVAAKKETGVQEKPIQDL